MKFTRSIWPITLVLLVLLGYAVGQEFDPANHPVENVASKYRANADEINALTKKVVDESVNAEERLSTLKKLRGKYPEALIPTAAAVVKDQDEKLASFAVELLVGEAVMSDHKMPMVHGEPSKAMKYMMSKHGLAKAGLRLAAGDSRPRVYENAAATLASLGDTKGIEAITDAGKAGMYGEDTVVGILGLAPPELGGKYIAVYLNSKLMNVQIAAIGQLSRIPEYESRVRTQYLLNKEAAPELRAAAARGLAAKANNLLPLLLDPDTDFRVVEEGVWTYFNSNLFDIDSDEAKMLENAVRRYGETHPKFNIVKVLGPLRSRMSEPNMKLQESELLGSHEKQRPTVRIVLTEPPSGKATVGVASRDTNEVTYYVGTIEVPAGQATWVYPGPEKPVGIDQPQKGGFVVVIIANEHISKDFLNGLDLHNAASLPLVKEIIETQLRAKKIDIGGVYVSEIRPL